MNFRNANLLFAMCLISICAYAQPAPEPITTTTVCEIVRHPEEFEKKRVQVRAQIWLYGKNYWLNESLADSLQFAQSCGWLPAQFVEPPTLVSDVAFGTFTGTVVREPGSVGKKLRMRFRIERQEDIYGRTIQIHNGPVQSPHPVLYDQRSGKLFMVPQ